MSELLLIIEDDARNRKLLRSVLEVHGYRCLEAVNGREGVEVAKQHLPDAILMDIQMPVMGGIEATRRLKNDPRTREIPVLALTSYAMNSDKERITAAGCDGYLAKPLNLNEVLHQLQRYLAVGRKT